MKKLITFLFVFFVFLFAFASFAQTRRTRRDAPLCPTQKKEVKTMLKPIKASLDSLKKGININITLSQEQKQMQAPVQQIQNPTIPVTPIKFLASFGMAGNRENFVENCQRKSRFRSNFFIEVGTEISYKGVLVRALFGGLSIAKKPLYTVASAGYEITDNLSILGGVLYRQTNTMELLYGFGELNLTPNTKNWGLTFRVASVPGTDPLFFAGLSLKGG